MDVRHLAAMIALAIPAIGAAQPMPGMAPPAAAPAAEQPFLSENQAAMDRMMAGMAAHPTGNIDKDFVAMMIPHHQGAIDMARAYLKSGTNPALRRLCREIIRTQAQEIATMQRAAR